MKTQPHIRQFSVRDRLDLSELHRRHDEAENLRRADASERATMWALSAVAVIAGASIFGLMRVALAWLVNNGVF